MARSVADYPRTNTWLLSDDKSFSGMNFCGGSLIGFSKVSPNKSTSNEDAAVVIELSDNHGLIVVADGMGGANAGDRAAKCIIETIAKSVCLEAVVGESVRSIVVDAIERANDTILGWGLGAGSTLVVVEYLNGSTRSIHIGDAMAMVCSNRGRIKASTVSHSPVAMGVEAGFIDEDEALLHEDRHLISNCVGSAEMKIELGPTLTMSVCDTVIVGSDGLFDNLTVDEIVSIVRAGHLKHQFNLLVNSARERMSAPDTLPSTPDDLTVICFRQ